MKKKIFFEIIISDWKYDRMANPADGKGTVVI